MRQSGPVQLLLQHRDRQQRRVALVHVIDRRLVFQSAQQPRSANTEDRLLAQPVVCIASVQMIGQRAIFRVILIQVRIQKINGNSVPRDAFHVVAPCPHRHRPPLNRDRDHRLFPRQCRLRIPRLRLLGLNAIRIQMLMEITLAVRQSDGRQRQTHIRRRPQRVARENPEAATVSGKLRRHRDFHREVGDNAAVTWFFRGEVLRSINKAHR